MASLLTDLPDFKKKPMTVQLKMLEHKKKLAEASREIFKKKFETEKNKVELLQQQLQAAENKIKQQKIKMEEMKLYNTRSQENIKHLNQLNHFHRSLTRPFNPNKNFELSMHTPTLVATPDDIVENIVVCSLSPKWNQISSLFEPITCANTALLLVRKDNTNQNVTIQIFAMIAKYNTTYVVSAGLVTQGRLRPRRIRKPLVIKMKGHFHLKHKADIKLKKMETASDLEKDYNLFAMVDPYENQLPVPKSSQ